MSNDTSTEAAKEALSNLMNSTRMYEHIQSIGVDYFGKYIDNDSSFWHELEDEIIQKIQEQ